MSFESGGWGKRKPPTYLTEPERDRLLAAAAGNPRDHAILTLFAFAGLRLNELVMLDRDDVDFAQKRITVRFAKGGKWRRLGLHPRAERALRAYLATRDDDNPALFLSRKGPSDAAARRPGAKGRLGRFAIEDLLAKYVAAADLGRKHVTPHCLRHTFATTLWRQTRDIQLVQRALGHSRITTTTIYMHLDDDQMSNAMMAVV
ncbi:MAG TPA: tyrosine-type recombinase/integrase [Thermomicrobiales bacterium]|nr:tyrosine-type recombinase/integrase [Thermomicrobiales bacterium]